MLDTCWDFLNYHFNLAVVQPCPSLTGERSTQLLSAASVLVSLFTSFHFAPLHAYRPKKEKNILMVKKKSCIENKLTLKKTLILLGILYLFYV